MTTRAGYPVWMDRPSPWSRSAPNRVTTRGALLVLAALALAVVSACGTTAVASRDAQKAREAESAKPPRAAASPKPSPESASSKSAPAAASPRPAPTDADRERFARAEWGPGQLEAHFQRHGPEGQHQTAEAYDAAARETIRTGTMFTYVDRESNAGRIGFYDKSANRFTAVSGNGRRLTTHFRPSRGEAYVRGLERSTYR